MQTIKVKAVEGRRILMPERGFKPVPANAVTVPLNAYYSRAIEQGDIAEVADEAPAAPIAVATAPAALASAAPAAPVVPAAPAAAAPAPAPAANTAAKS